MKRKLLLFTLIIVTFPSYQSCFGQSNSDEKYSSYLQQAIQEDIRRQHFKPVLINDSFSQKAFKDYIKQLDYLKRLMLQSDFDALNEYSDKIDDEYTNSSFDFFNLSYSIIAERTKAAERYCMDAIKTSFDFNTKESIQFNADSLNWAKDTNDLKKRWQNMLQYDIVSRIYSDMKSQEEAKKKTDTVTVKSFAELEQNARESVERRYRDWFDYMLQNERNDYLSMYFNAILSVYDPHTEYYPPKDKEDFDIRFSGQLQGIGATLSQKDGYITVVNIVPGSPSWKQGELEVDDKILKVAQGDSTPIDITGMRTDKAVKYIRGNKGTEVRLTVQKVDGTQKVISIIRDIVIIEETYAKSMVLTDKKTKEKLGYIYLPSFYANFQDAAGRRSSVDMKREIERLKGENISSIIIDLRNNGGGSLSDCVDIAGLFIDEGPVVQVKGKEAFTQVLQDRNAGTSWDGPVVVLVNNYSASASEIFAAVMQDYKRAIIMGSTTYGKGTVQRFDDLDQLLLNENDMKSFGSIKITTSNYYRVNGQATQLKGVVPDIQVPDIYRYMKTGERERDNALPWMEIQTTKYDIWKNGSCDWTNTVKNSDKRIEKSKYFSEIDKNAKFLKARQEHNIYPLNYKEFKAFMDKQNKEAERFKNIGKDTLDIDARILTEETSNIANDSAAAERNSRWLQMVITDNTLYEAMKVAQDLEKINCYIKKD